MLAVQHLSRLIYGWMSIVIVAAMFLARSDADSTSAFFHLGPSPHLVIMGFTVDTPTRYVVVVSYCCINAVIRTLFHNVISPWLVNHVQDSTKPMTFEVKKYAYEITIVNTAYTWFDWLLTLEILLSQIDMFIIELVTDFAISMGSTRHYLRLKTQHLGYDHIEHPVGNYT